MARIEAHSGKSAPSEAYVSLRQMPVMLASRSTIQSPAAAELAALRAVPMFAGLSADAFTTLAETVALKLVAADEQILREGARLEWLYVLIDGMVELYSEHGKDSFGFMLLRAPSVFILAPLLLDAPCLNSARAIRPSKLVLMPAHAVKKAIADYPAFARAVEREQAHAYRHVLKELKNRKFRTMIERLANWLLVNLEPRGEGGVVVLPFSRRRLAAYLGATPETLSRIFGELCEHGVSGHSQEIRVASVAALAKVAHPDPLIDGPE